ncbi:hypothetical protein Dimus_029976, partial [Dionaea muscipula]
MGMKQLHKESFTNMSERVQEARHRLTQCQDDLRQSFSEEKRILMLRQVQELQFLLQAEE